MIENETNKIKGIAACYGKATGNVVYLLSQADLVKVNKQTIVVTDKITSEYTSAFTGSAAVISRVGGVTCHAAIVCREFKVPCIVQCSDCFEIFKEGEKIELDTKEMNFQLIL